MQKLRTAALTASLGLAGLIGLPGCSNHQIETPVLESKSASEARALNFLESLVKERLPLKQGSIYHDRNLKVIPKTNADGWFYFPEMPVSGKGRWLENRETLKAGYFDKKDIIPEIFASIYGSPKAVLYEGDRIVIADYPEFIDIRKIGDEWTKRSSVIIQENSHSREANVIETKMPAQDLGKFLNALEKVRQAYR